MKSFTPRENIIETVNRLFVYTDEQKWDKLQEEVFTEEVLFDMSSLGGESKTTTAKEICEGWAEGFKGLDAVNHLSGNYVVDLKGHYADVLAYATATHYKEAATQGKIREFVGTYELHLLQTDAGWRIDKFKYNLKYMNGNVELE
jgi:hypothetical protein